MFLLHYMTLLFVPLFVLVPWIISFFWILPDANRRGQHKRRSPLRGTKVREGKRENNHVTLYN